MTTALVFPGQGSQQEGMARPWRGHPAFARWQQAEDILGRPVVRLGLEASAEELREPAACQVALFVHHAVLLSAWQELGEPVAYVAGHSLGEYSALLAADVLSFAEALRLVDARARLSAAAAEDRPGGMVACLGADLDEVTAAAERSQAHVGNDNAPGQVVVSGAPDALGRFRETMASARGKVIPLDVGAAYHSPLIAPAVTAFRRELDGAPFRTARVPVVANVDAQPHAGAGDWPELLARQLTAPVRWRETVLTLQRLGVQEVTELAASPVLTGLVKRTARRLGRRTLVTPDDMVLAMGVVA
jgi:[acyl-carrier-protein] S-malonyltransferase